MDYGEITESCAPRNPHPDSILWRSRYTPSSPRADILHGQEVYWGRRGIHDHQFLRAGENTLNLQLANRLLLLLDHGEYSPEKWLQCFIEFMTTPGRHKDTYVEEYLRSFSPVTARGHHRRSAAEKMRSTSAGFACCCHSS